MFKHFQKKKKICVALSGGVDSSVAAYVLKKQGHEVFGVFVRGYNVDGCQDREAHDARRVADTLGIPFYVLDFEQEYYNRVVQYLLDGYACGITPNPDVVCNSEIKFGLLYDAAMKLGADAVASGHYAQTKLKTKNRKLIIGNNYALKAGKDDNKDQSYFLWQIPHDRFSKILFPIGGLTKPRVRALAKKAGLFTATKKDSQGVCFLGKFSFVDFLKKHIPYGPGEVLDINGKKVGTHDGVLLYTLGQRHGFINTAGHELFVIKRDITSNTLVVAPEGDAALSMNVFYAQQINFLNARFEKKLREGKEMTVLARVRYRQLLFKARVSLKDGILTIYPSRTYKLFPTAGQSVVLYTKRGVVLGGGVITE
ncbi:MAG: tRNA 2-thiouridine(34) synthase MnmA [Candidatus Paceibacterota bacterium]